MHNNQTQIKKNINYDEEIFFLDLVRFLIDSKKIIALITIVVTIFGLILSFQIPWKYQSIAYLEIGRYESSATDLINPYSPQLIEPMDITVQETSIQFNYDNDSKNDSEIKIIAQEGRILKILTTTSSIKSNQQLADDVITFILNRHSSLIDIMIDKSITEIENLDNKIKYLDSLMENPSDTQINNFDVSHDNTVKIQNLIDIVFKQASLANERRELETQKKSLMIDQTITKLLKKSDAQKINSFQKNLIILFSFFAGIFLSLITVFAISYKEFAKNKLEKY